jgi:hypothetical protein
MGLENLVNVAHPSDLTYQTNRQNAIRELMKLSPQDLDRKLRLDMQRTPMRDEHHMSQKVIGEITTAPFIPDKLKAGILDSTSGTTGSVLIRQDLEPTLYTLFVKTFPAFERLSRGPANGLVHAFNQITSPDSTNGLGGTIITELGTVNYVSSTYVRQTAPIAVFATGRGISFKELAAVAQGGAPYDPHKTELANGMIKLATDVQGTILQGNASNATGTSASEAGLYNGNAFDGLRGILGSQGTFAANNAIQVDIGSLNVTETLQSVATKAANNGGMPDMVMMTMNAKQALDQENQGNRRYNDSQLEIIPGVHVNRVAWANGELDILPVPGNTFGQYNRASDNALVEDMYVLDTKTITLRWLYSESFTVLQIPSGVDGVLSERFIIFGMFGMEVAAPIFCGKARRLAA